MNSNDQHNTQPPMVTLRLKASHYALLKDILIQLEASMHLLHETVEDVIELTRTEPEELHGLVNDIRNVVDWGGRS